MWFLLFGYLGDVEKYEFPKSILQIHVKPEAEGVTELQGRLPVADFVLSMTWVSAAKLRASL